MSHRKIIGFDFLRGISAIIVLLYHYTFQYNRTYSPEDSYFFRIPWGYMAVSVFFILSGYLITEHLRASETAGHFMIKRALRLYPSYWVCMVITILVTYTLLPSAKPSLMEILVNITMLQPFVGVDNVDGVYWTLQSEIVFYLLIAFLLLIKKADKFLVAGFAWVVSGLILNLLSLQFHHIVLTLFSKLIVPRYAHMFVAGIVICRYRKWCWEKTVFLLLCLLNQLIAHGIGYTLFFVGAIVVIMLAASEKSIIVNGLNRIGHSICGRFLSTIAGLSYPLYLVHQNLGYAIINLMKKLGLYSEWFLLIPIGISLGIAYLIHRFVELPALKLGNSLMKKRHIWG